MKRSIIIPVALLALSGALAAFAPPAKTTLTLDEALAADLVTAELVSKGGYSGKCVKLKLYNNTKKNLEIVVPEGTLLYPEDEGDQTLLMPEQQILALTREDGRSFSIPGFCTEASDRSPGEGSSFSLGASSSNNLQKLAAYINAHPEVLKYEDAVQSAVWAVSNDHGVSSIYEEGKQPVHDLRAAVCDITGKENVWYNTQTNRRMLDDRSIVSEPQSISGKLEITSESNMKVRSFVMNDKREVVFSRENETALPPGTAKFTFSLVVSGWAEGTYQVVYVNQADTVLKQPFLIEV